MFRIGLITCCLLLANQSTFAQEGATEKASDGGAEKGKIDKETAKRYARFKEKMSGVKLVGKFTILGRDGDPPKEEYVIESVKKLPQGDKWLISARIKYGNKNTATIPMPLDVKWAGDTPMISLTKLTIPGLGTFSSRVIFYNNKYAGTWTHGDVGGHMFGSIEKLEKKEDGE